MWIQQGKFGKAALVLSSLRKDFTGGRRGGECESYKYRQIKEQKESPCVTMFEKQHCDISGHMLRANKFQREVSLKGLLKGQGCFSQLTKRKTFQREVTLKYE